MIDCKVVLLVINFIDQFDALFKQILRCVISIDKLVYWRKTLFVVTNFIGYLDVL